MSTLGKKTVEDIEVKGRNVLVRCDFNVPMKDGVITNDNRINAALPTIKKLINEKVVLAEFLMQAITRGSNDVGRVHVQVECGSRTVHGFGAHTDTTRASIEAFLDALRALNVTEKIEEED